MKSLIRPILQRFSRLVATRLAIAKPIRRVPGWWSGLADQSPTDANRSTRLGFWQQLSGTPIQVPWYGLKLELMLGNDLSRCLYVDGEVDPNEFSFLDEVLRPGMTVIDAGANEGIYSVFCRARLESSGRVIAIEPSARERARIEKNKWLNGMNDITVLPLALCEQGGSVTLRIAESSHAGHNTLGAFAAPWVRTHGEETVPAATLDSIVESARLAAVDLIKLDIEGAELRALRGAEQTLRRYFPALLVEVMDETLATQGASATQLIEYVRQLDYQIFEFSPATGRPVALSSPVSQLIGVLALHPQGSINPRLLAAV